MLQSVICRDACLINEGDSFLLTGGYGVYNTVSRYSMKGWIGDLKEMVHGRIFHGCTQFDGTMDRKVTESFYNIIQVLTLFQVNIVCGGLDADREQVTSCEVNMSGQDSWQLIQPLPVAIHGLRGITLNGNIFMIGT